MGKSRLRVPLVVFGAALVVLGTVVWFVPLESASSRAPPVPVGSGFKFGLVGPLVLGAVPFTVTWTSSSQDLVKVYSCKTNAACPSFADDAVVAHGSGASGSMAWSGKAGQYYLFVPSANSNVTVTYVEPLVGGFLGVSVLGAGVLAAAAGLLIRGRPRTPRSSGASR